MWRDRACVPCMCVCVCVADEGRFMKRPVDILESCFGTRRSSRAGGEKQCRATSPSPVEFTRPIHRDMNRRAHVCVAVRIKYIGPP